MNDVLDKKNENGQTNTQGREWQIRWPCPTTTTIWPEQNLFDFPFRTDPSVAINTSINEMNETHYLFFFDYYHVIFIIFVNHSTFHLSMQSIKILIIL